MRRARPETRIVAQAGVALSTSAMAQPDTARVSPLS